MTVDEIILKCTAFIGYPTERGFAASGTGFFATFSEGEFDFGYLITAAHVVHPNRKRTNEIPDNTIHVRINLKHGFRVDPTNVRNEWVFHSDRLMDVCALPLGIHPGDPTELDDADPDISFLNLVGIAVPHLANLDPAKNAQLGDEVFITGVFVGRVGEKKNTPVVRIGNIAALPQEPLEFTSPRKPAFLLETRSLGGISGSPVFINYASSHPRGRSHVFRAAEIDATDPTRRREKIMVPYGLLAMMLGSHSGQYAEDFVEENDADILPPKDADFNAGIGVAMAIADIVEFIHKNQALQEKRKEAVAEREKQ